MKTKTEIRHPAVLVIDGGCITMDGVATPPELITHISSIVTIRLKGGDEIRLYPDDTPKLAMVLSPDDAYRVKELFIFAKKRDISARDAIRSANQLTINVSE